MTFLSKGIHLFQSHIKNKFIRFIFVGGINTLFGVGVYCLMIFIGLPYVWATLVSQVLGVLFNFMTTGTLVFENNNPRLIFRFVLNYILTYFLNIGINRLIQDLTGANTYVSGIGASLITALFSFFILKFFVYKEKSNEKNQCSRSMLQ